MAGGHHLHQVYADPGSLDYGEQTFLGSMGVGARVGLFVVLGLLALAVLAGGLVFADRQLTQATDRLLTAREQLDLADKVEKGAWRLRASERAFLAGDGQRAEERFDLRVTTLSNVLDALFARAEGTPIAGRLAAVNESLARYTGVFREVATAAKTLSRTGDAGLQQTVRGLGDELAVRVGETDLPGLKNLLVQLRAAVPAPGGDLAAFEKARKAFSLALGSAPIGDDRKAEVRTLLERYVAAVTTVAEAEAVQRDGTARLEDVFTAMAGQIDSLVSVADEERILASQQEQRVRGLMRLGIAAGAGGALLLVILLGWILMHSISRPLKALAATANRVMGGEDSVPIPALGNHDEVGEVARVLARLRTDVAEAPRLRADLEQARGEAGRWADEVERLKHELEAARRTSAAAPAAEPPRPLPAEAPSRLNKLWSGSISSISRDVALSSQTVSTAAYEAERTGTMIRGLNEAADGLRKVEGLLAQVTEQTNLLAYREGEAEGGGHNLIVLSSDYRGESGADGTAPAARLETIRSAAGEAGRGLNEVSATLAEIKAAALDLATATSEEALAVTARLMEQSESLRSMLDALVGRIQDRDDATLGGDEVPKSPGGDS